MQARVGSDDDVPPDQRDSRDLVIPVSLTVVDCPAVAKRPRREPPRNSDHCLASGLGGAVVEVAVSGFGGEGAPPVGWTCTAYAPLAFRYKFKMTV